MSLFSISFKVVGGTKACSTERPPENILELIFQVGFPALCRSRNRVVRIFAVDYETKDFKTSQA